jgi:hypothetical protein
MYSELLSQREFVSDKPTLNHPAIGESHKTRFTHRDGTLCRL